MPKPASRRATTQLAALNALAQRAGQRVGTCPHCEQQITGHDLLAAGQCGSCHQTLSGLILPERTAPSLDQRELHVLVGALGTVLAIAYIASKWRGGERAMTDRRAGKIPHVPSPGGSKQPRARNSNGRWYAKHSDAGKSRGKASKGGLFGWVTK